MMIAKRLIISTVVMTLLIVLSIPSCTHDPFIGDPLEEPMDTLTSDTTTMDTTDNPTDTTSVENPCDENVIYFESMILPILQTNCAISGCHDAVSANEGVILESYNSVIASNIVTPLNLDESDLYEVLVEDDEDKRMPPIPASALTANQINTIATWILQGAEDLTCDDSNNGGCITSSVSFIEDVSPVIETFCRSCHSGNNPSGGTLLDNYENIKANALNGKIYGVISWSEGFPMMPQGSDQLNDCTIQKIKAWIDDGANNN